MNRAPKPPKRSTTPTSATFSQSTEHLPPPSPTAPTPAKPLYLCSPFVEAALVRGNFKTIVMQPKHVDVMEWVAVNSTSHFSCLSRMVAWLETQYECTTLLVFDFYTNLNQFYGVLAECCTQQSCPSMTAGPQYVVVSSTLTSYSVSALNVYSLSG